jgi:hypothetical protein
VNSGKLSSSDGSHSPSEEAEPQKEPIGLKSFYQFLSGPVNCQAGEVGYLQCFT